MILKSVLLTNWAAVNVAALSVKATIAYLPAVPVTPDAPLAPTPSWFHTSEYSFALQIFETLRIPVRLLAHPETSAADALVAYDKVEPRTKAALTITTDFEADLNENIYPLSLV
jgi:hypothetical protein